jgi:hypothetical protein
MLKFSVNIGQVLIFIAVEGGVHSNNIKLLAKLSAQVQRETLPPEFYTE